MSILTHDHHQQDQFSEYKNLAKLIYLLQAMAFFTGGITFFIAIVLDYLNKERVKDSWLESHYEWQINTFWIALVLVIIAIPSLPFIFGFVVLIATIIWAIHRIVYGWICLNKSLAISRTKKIPLI